jgi:hypothetical protein
MQVIYHGLGLYQKETFQKCYPFFKRSHGLEVLQIADVVAQKGIVPLGETKGVFQLRAAGQHAPAPLL